MPQTPTPKRDRTYRTQENYGNVVSDGQRMPDKGWITSFRVNFGGIDEPIEAKLCIWDRPDGELVYKSETRSIGVNPTWREVTGISVMMDQGRHPVLGFWRPIGQPCEFYAQKDDDGNPNREFRVSTYIAENDAPNPLPGGDKFEGILCRDFTYVRQERPLKPGFLNPTPLEDEVSNLSLRVAFTLPHGDDANHDWTERCQIRVVNRDTNGIFYDAWHEVEEGAEEFDFTLPNLLAPDTKYKLMVRHQDTWGSPSEWRERNFRSSAGPDLPEVTSPLGRQIVQKPTPWTGTYNNPLGIAFSRVQLEIWNEKRTNRLYSSGDLVATLTGSTWSVTNAWLGANNLPWGKTFAARARVKDANGNYGGWYWWEFFTNAAPRVPFDLKPSGGKLTPTKVLTARLNDPDGDPITQVAYEVRNRTTNVLVASGNMTIAPDGRSASVDPSGLVSDVAYNWRAYASDGSPPSPSAWSQYQDFIWAPVPTIALTTPEEEPPVNRVEDPSFEYSTAYWTDSGEVAGVSTIDRVNDSDSYEGDWSCRGVVGDVTHAPVRRGGFMAVDTTRAYYFSGMVMREFLSPTAVTHMGLDCYNSGGTLLGTIYPGNLVNGADPGTAWNEREGFVGPAAVGFPTQFPVGTTQVRWHLEPSRNKISTVRFDAMQMRLLSAGTTYAHAQSGKAWLGYFDGDTDSYRGNNLDFEWTNVTGASISQGRLVLDFPNTSINFLYSSPAGSLKNSDRLIIQQYARGQWKTISDSGFVASTRTTVPIPGGLLRDSQLYRFKLYVRDSGAVPRTAETEWIMFQANYQGPTPLQIVESSGVAESAAIRIRWTPTTLDQLQFGGYEVGIAEFGQRQPSAILALIGNPELTEYVWQEPKANERYTLMVRQIENVGAEQIAGRWSRALGIVEFRQWFVKSLARPEEVNLGFDLQASDIVSFDYPSPSTEVLMYDEETPTYYTDPREQAVGAVVIRLERGDPDLDRKERVLNELKKLRHYGALLHTTYPSETFHMHLDTIKREFSDMPWHTTWTLGFKQMSYEVDYYLREGVTRG